MKKFLAIYHTPKEAMAWMQDASPEDQKAGMQKWMDWKEAHEACIVDFGAPLASRGNIGTGPTHVTISGYSVLQAESMEALEEECKDHPHIGWHPEAYIEFFELALF